MTSPTPPDPPERPAGDEPAGPPPAADQPQTSDQSPATDQPPAAEPPPTAHTQPLGSGTQEQPPPAAGPKRLTRSRADRMLGGVAGGLGRHFELDPALFRLAFVILTLFGGSGIVLYIALLLILPSDDAPAPLAQTSRRTNVWLIAGLAVLALIALPFVGTGLFFVGPGIIVLGAAAAAGVLLWRAVGGDPDRRLVRASLIVLAVIAALAVGLGGGVAVAFGGGPIVAGVIIAAGVVLALGGLFGGARWLIVPAFLLAVPLAVVAAADIDVDGGVGEREYRPASMADLRPEYRLGVGELRVDLRYVDFPAGRTEVDARIGVGSLRVLVPGDVCVQTSAHVGAGRIELLNRESDGVDVEVDERPDAAPGAPVLLIDADAGLGNVEIDYDGWDFERPGPPLFDRGFGDDDDAPVLEQRACERA